MQLFLAALSTKSAKAETTDEIAGCAAAMREHAVQVKTGMDVFEIVGTGGDNAKHGNRAAFHYGISGARRQHRPSPFNNLSVVHRTTSMKLSDLSGGF